jgi:ABC-type Zn uptake system ZnuABC Zn-binding protein ZnuA
MHRRGKIVWGLALVIACLSTACGLQPSTTSFDDQLTHLEDLNPASLADDRPLRVVATINILGDVIANIGGDSIELITILPMGADPHAYQMTASDLQALRQADIVFLNGLGLEESMHSSLDQFTEQVPMVSASEGIEGLTFGSEEEEGQDVEAEHQHDIDPHVWMDPTQVMIWVQNITQALTQLDPDHAGTYQSNAADYMDALEELDEWIQDQVDNLPDERRILVTDHDNLGYFASRYGMQLVGAVVPAYSAAAEPSARELAQLQDAIQALGAPAIFVGTTVNPDLALQIADDLGIQVVPIYTGSLSEPGGGASTYLQFMEYDVNMIVEALDP